MRGKPHVITSAFRVATFYEVGGGDGGEGGGYIRVNDVTCERLLERYVWVHGVQWRDET